MKLQAKKLPAISGFTLIELLVVIAIISLLSSIVLASLSQTRVKARDSKRVQDLIQLRNAMELYFAKYGRYPKNVNDFSHSCWDCPPFDVRYDGTRLGSPPDSDLSEFLNPRPLDPKPKNGTRCGYWYITNPSTPTEYKIAIVGTVENIKNIPLTLHNPPLWPADLTSVILGCGSEAVISIYSQGAKDLFYDIGT